MKNYIIRRTKFIHNHLTILHPWNSEVLGYENAIFGMGWLWNWGTNYNGSSDKRMC